jgi:hypothetical protein
MKKLVLQKKFFDTDLGEICIELTDKDGKAAFLFVLTSSLAPAFRHPVAALTDTGAAMHLDKLKIGKVFTAAVDDESFDQADRTVFVSDPGRLQGVSTTDIQAACRLLLGDYMGAFYLSSSNESSIYSPSKKKVLSLTPKMNIITDANLSAYDEALRGVNKAMDADTGKLVSSLPYMGKNLASDRNDKKRMKAVTADISTLEGKRDQQAGMSTTGVVAALAVAAGLTLWDQGKDKQRSGGDGASSAPGQQNYQRASDDSTTLADRRTTNGFSSRYVADDVTTPNYFMEGD